MYCREKGQPRVLSSTPGRLRLHLQGWHDERAGRVEALLLQVPGVEAAQASPLTGNVLVRFDPRATSAHVVVAAAGALGAGPPDGRGLACLGGTREAPPSPSSARGGKLLRAGLRGLLGHGLVDAVWYAVTFTEPFGLPLAGLGVLHLGLDIAVWTAGLAPLLPELVQGSRR